MRLRDFDELLAQRLVDSGHPEIAEVEITAGDDNPTHYTRLVLYTADRAMVVFQVKNIRGPGIPNHAPWELPREAAGARPERLAQAAEQPGGGAATAVEDLYITNQWLSDLFKDDPEVAAIDEWYEPSTHYPLVKFSDGVEAQLSVTSSYPIGGRRKDGQPRVHREPDVPIKLTRRAAGH